MSRTDLTNAVLLPHNYNTRHFGGYTTNDGRRIKKEKLIRSGITTGFKEEDLRILSDDYHLMRVIDLRSSKEAEEKPSLNNLPGVEYINIDLLGNIWGNVDIEKSADKILKKEAHELLQLFYLMGGKMEGVIEFFSKQYLGMIRNEHSQNMLQQIFNLLLDDLGGGTLFHCAGGKDRTGVLSALILSVLGVDWEKCVEDYLLTNDFFKELNETQLNEVDRETDNPEIIEKISYMLRANVVYIRGAYDLLIREYGSMDNYLSQVLLLTDDKIKRLREIYTIED